MAASNKTSKVKLTTEKMCELVGCKEYSYLGDEIYPQLFDKEKRERLFKKFLDVEPDLSKEWFTETFQQYMASLKTLAQHYTPPEIGTLLNEIIGTGGGRTLEPSAGTGMLLVSRWHHDRLKTHPFHYRPSNFFYMAEEKSKKNIPFLLFNCLIRGMNAVIIHGDTLTREAEQVYYVVNEDDDMMKFSYLNIMPRTKATEEYFDIREWTGEAKEHIESPNYAMQKEWG